MVCELTRMCRRSSDDDSKQGEIKRQLVELEREIGLTTPLIAELDGRLTSEKPQSPASPAAETSSPAEPSVKTAEVESRSSAAVEKMPTAVDSGLQMETSASSSRTVQVCWKLVLMLLKDFVPSVLRRCWLGGRKGIRPVKIEWWGTGMVISLEQDADLHMTQLMQLPLTVSCFSEIQIGFTFLVPAHPGFPGKRAVKRVCVCC